MDQRASLVFLFVVASTSFYLGFSQVFSCSRFASWLYELKPEVKVRSVLIFCRLSLQLEACCTECRGSVGGGLIAAKQLKDILKDRVRMALSTCTAL